MRALVGGLDFGTQNLFNRALQARRQPGSSMKPFVWGAAVESRRFTPGTIVYDTPDLYRDPWTGKEWKPRNFEKRRSSTAPCCSARRWPSRRTPSR